jgi:hypothetical protein
MGSKLRLMFPPPFSRDTTVLPIDEKITSMLFLTDYTNNILSFSKKKPKLSSHAKLNIIIQKSH